MSRAMKPDYAKFSAADTAKMEEITGVPANAMLVQSGLLPTPPTNAKVLDNACGGGLLTSVLFNAIGNSTDTTVVCADLEEYMVRGAADRIKENGWNGEAVVADAQALPFPDNHFSHNLMNFAIQLIPDPALAMRESFRVLKSGGTVGMTYWVAPGWLESFKLGIKGFTTPTFLQGLESLKETTTSLVTAAGFINVNIQPIKLEHTDDLSRFVKYMKQTFTAVLAGEAGEQYEAYMRNRYGEGDFTLTWEALIVTAEKP